MVKKDLVGNPLQGDGGEKKRKKPQRFSLTKSVSENGGYMLSGLVAGVVGVGGGTAISSAIGPLRRWRDEGGIKGFIAVGGPAVLITGLEMLALAKITTPKNAMATAPWAFGATALLVAAPVLAESIVSKIDEVVTSFVLMLPGTSGDGATTTTTTTEGRGPVPRMRERRVLTADQIIAAEKVRTRPQATATRQSTRRRWS